MFKITKNESGSIHWMNDSEEFVKQSYTRVTKQPFLWWLISGVWHNLIEKVGSLLWIFERPDSRGLIEYKMLHVCAWLDEKEKVILSEKKGEIEMDFDLGDAMVVEFE